MSSYMQALKRLRDDALPAAAAPRAASQEAARTRPVARAAAAAATPAVPSAAPQINALLDRLRALAAQGAAARVLVFAAVESGGAARRVVDALAARGRELGLPVAAAELTRAGGQAQLAARGSAPRGLTLDGPALPAGLAAWLDDCAAAPLVLFDAPPVLSSIDGLLLAAACDGLVLIAETGATARQALREASARAQAAGCRLLGVVLCQ